MLADGFYEWQKKDARTKQPYHIHLKNDDPFGFAGLWECWHDAQGNPVESCTVLTTEANELMQPLHDRMPVILQPEAFARWLDPQEKPEALLALLQPLPADLTRAYAISIHVNNARNDDPACVEPLVKTS